VFASRPLACLGLVVAFQTILVGLATFAEQPYGIDKRVPWTTSHVVGSPDPPYPYQIERVYAKLRMNSPLDVQGTPDGKRWLIVEEYGRLYSLPRGKDATQGDPFLDLATKHPAKPHEVKRMWSMTFHPKYLENGYIFVCYMDSERQPNQCRIVRYTVPEPKADKPPQCDPLSAKTIVEWPSGVDHFGGCLKFGRDGYLYFSIGDGHGYADGNNSGQDITDWQASIHRIDVDHGEGAGPYRVPADNPFVRTPNARPEIWAYGLRNVWKMSFDSATGELWGGDVGQDLWDMVVRVEKGGNYGWSVVEGTHPFKPEQKVGPTPILKPVYEHEHSQARSVTGGFVYHGKQFPDLQNAYVYGDYETGRIWALRYDGRKVTEHRELIDTPLKLVGFGEAADGELILLDYTGSLHELRKTPPADPANPPPPFPRKLSQTGLYSSTSANEVAPGVVPYTVNSPLWSDHAYKERFLAIPGNGQIKYAFPKAWEFPDGSVLVKTFALEFEVGNPASRRRIETRILHIEQNDWRGYTFLWNEEQTDAVLLENPRGLDREYTIKDGAAPGGIRKQQWHFPSRAECTLCHTMPAGFVLGPSTVQMNGEFDYGGVRDNQIRALEHAGYFSSPVLAAHAGTLPGSTPPKSYADLPRIVNPSDEKFTLDERARSYLHANCAHCHQKWGGGNALFELQSQLSLADTKTLGIKPQHGDLNIPGAELLHPGDPEHSLLLQRMRRVDERRMPRVGSGVRDLPAEKLIEAWIKQLPPQ